LGSALPLLADTRVRQSDQTAFTCLAVGIRRASAEVRTRQISAADTACPVGTQAVISAATEVAAAILMVITTRSEKRPAILTVSALTALRTQSREYPRTAAQGSMQVSE
jgi:hypothetical protein